jgi:hypothetical protein
MTDEHMEPEGPEAEGGLEQGAPVIPYPSTTVPTIAAVGALMTLAALVTALTEMEPYTWALAPFIFVFAALPYFGLALRARRAMRPLSQLILIAAALITVAFGGYIYFVDVFTTQESVSAGIFITVPLWQTLPLALAVGIIWMLEPRTERNAAPESLSEDATEVDETNESDDQERRP